MNLTTILDELDQLPSQQRLRVYETALRNLCYIDEQGAMRGDELPTFLASAAEPFIADSKRAAEEDAHERALPPGEAPAGIDHRPPGWGFVPYEGNNPAR